jgi:hypothetical protein
MIRSAQLILGISAAVLMSGCVIAPLPPPGVVEQGYAAPPGVVYVQPTYAIPAPGYAWQYNARFGWGWHHPRYGWHRGWR